MDGKTADERAAADPTREIEDTGWLSRMGAGAVSSAISSFTRHDDHGHGRRATPAHGHSHGGVPCDGNHGMEAPSGSGTTVNHGHGIGIGATPSVTSGSATDGASLYLRAAEAQGKSPIDRFILACVLNAKGEAAAILAQAASTTESKPSMESVNESEAAQAAEEVARYGTKALLNTVDDIGYTAMHHACYRGNIETAEWLLQQPDLDLQVRTADAQHKLGATALHLAVSNGSLLLVKKILASGLEVDSRDNRKCTPLIIAAQYGETLITHLLLRLGADPLAVDHHQDTAMHWAAYKGHSELVSLYATGALSGCMVSMDQADEYGQTAMHLAALRGNDDTVKTLIELGADSAINDRNGRTPLKLAVDRRDPNDKKRTYGQIRVATLLEPKGYDLATFRRWWIGNPYQMYLIMSLMYVHTMYAYSVMLRSSLINARQHMVFVVLLFIMTFSWQVAHRMDPGSPDSSAKQEYTDAITEICDTGIEPWSKANGRKLCHTSREIRPLRAKYCKQLRKNVLRFDHNCPWMANTIGYRNQVWFYTYCWSATLALAYWPLLCWQWIHATEHASWHVTVSMIYQTPFALFGVAMWASQSHQAAMNLTTNEQINKTRYPHFNNGNPFDNGIVDNLLMYFQLKDSSKIDNPEWDPSKLRRSSELETAESSDAVIEMEM
jgi:ankyrin repeat protein